MVLIARITIEQADGRAGMYGVVLGLAVFISTNVHRISCERSYHVFSLGRESGTDGADSGGVPIGWSGIALISTTHGKIRARAFWMPPVWMPTQSEEEEVEEEEDYPEQHKKVPEGVSGWLDRYRLHREQQDKKPHTPGVWVVYFSLAALPLFGLGKP